MGKNAAEDILSGWGTRARALAGPDGYTDSRHSRVSCNSETTRRWPDSDSKPHYDNGGKGIMVATIKGRLNSWPKPIGHVGRLTLEIKCFGVGAGRMTGVKQKGYQRRMLTHGAVQAGKRKAAGQPGRGLTTSLRLGRFWKTDFKTLAFVQAQNSKGVKWGIK